MAVQAFRQAAVRWEGFEMDLTDGVKLTGKEGWVHVRPSATEAILRIIAESRDLGKAHELKSRARDIVME